MTRPLKSIQVRDPQRLTPAVYIFSRAVPGLFGELPGLVELLVVNLFVVASLTWFFMPVLTTLFSRWLQTGSN